MIHKEIVLEAIRSYLRNNLTNLARPKDSVRVMQDEKVPPGAGEEFIGIHGGVVENLFPPNEVTKKIHHGFRIGITRRLQGVPNEEAGETIYTYDANKVARIKPSMLARAREIANLVDTSWTLIANINSALTAAGECPGFITTFGFVSLDPELQEVNEDHFDQEPSRGMGGDIRYIGLLMELEFAGAEYYETIYP